MVEPTASAQHAPPPFATLRLPHHPSHLPDSSPAQAPSFYKRPLPATCTAFDSTEGKALFKRAMAEGYMENYFPLAQSFLTQDEPAYCGLATLCMILNALGVDPQQQFKGPWRWYTQSMLDCCRSLSDVAKDGITLSEFACLARCNGLHETTYYGDTVSLEQFERDVERVCGPEEGSVMAISYSRKTLGQTGDGHFSPIAGYCKESRRVLVLDVARFKYPSYWVAIEQLHDSLKPIDKVTKQPRGYSILRTASSVAAQDSPTTTSSGLMSLNFDKQTWPAFLGAVARLRGLDLPSFVEQTVTLAHQHHSSPLRRRFTLAAPATDPDSAESKLDAASAQTLSEAYDRDLRQVIAGLRQSTLWRMVNKALAGIQPAMHADAFPSPALETSLFMLALMQHRSPPASVKAAARQLKETEGSSTLATSPAVLTQASFLQAQMTSLEKCCSKEMACSCLNQDSPSGSCKV